MKTLSKARIAEQIASVEDLLRKLNLVKRERAQVLKDLKDRVNRFWFRDHGF
jgi:hypothetical protein